MKWFGDIGFKEEIEEEPGVWVPKVIPRQFYGDVLRDSWREQQADKINADLHVSNKLSVVADQYLQNNFHKIAYVTFGGAKWTVSGVEVNYPRLTLDLGSLYLEEEETNEDEG
jgi:hypothetical protein